VHVERPPFRDGEHVGRNQLSEIEREEEIGSGGADALGVVHGVQVLGQEHGDPPITAQIGQRFPPALFAQMVRVRDDQPHVGSRVQQPARAAEPDVAVSRDDDTAAGGAGAHS
jgi:hypothetical protein